MTKTYFPLHSHSHFSILDGLAQPTQIVKRLKEIGCAGSALTDHGSISGAIQFLSKMNDGKLKPIIGIEMYVCDEDATIKTASNRTLSHLLLLAKNDDGWKQLVKIVSEANKPEHFYYKPRLSLEQLARFLDGNLIGISGHLGSHIAKCYDFEEDNHPNLLGITLAQYMQKIFGKDNFFLEVQLIDSKNSPDAVKIAQYVRELSKLTNIKCVATPDSHYCRRQDALDQRVLLCISLHKTLAEAAKESILKCFFESDCFHIPTYDEMIECGNTEEELANTLLVADMCSEYKNILQQPTLPPYKCPNGLSEEAYLRQLCKEGWDKKIRDIIPKEEQQVYADRVKRELDVITKTGFAGYFLIVADILNYIRSKGWFPNIGRGSVGGCLIAYLIDITQVDSIKYNLLFERFMHEGRVSYPDIDVDLEKAARDHVIQYLKQKYGHDYVSQMITYQTMKGRGALKDVLRTYGNIGFEEMNRITKLIPDEAKISGELQEMKDERGESSIILYALENERDVRNNPKAKNKHKKGNDTLQEWCYVDDDDELKGPLSKEFEQAIRLERTKTSQSKHAAGIAISPKPLHEICPMIYDSKENTLVAGLEMNDLEQIGVVKLDLLGIVMLDKVMGVKQILEHGDII